MARDNVYRLRLTAKERDIIDRATERGGFPSIAAFIRAAAAQALAQSEPLVPQSEQSRHDRPAP